MSWTEESYGFPFEEETAYPGLLIPGQAVPGFAGAYRTEWTEEDNG